MAWIEKRNDTYHIAFRYGGRDFKRSLRTADEQEAIGRLALLKDNLRLVERGRLEIPPEADPAVFLLSDARISRQAKLPKTIGLRALCEEFLASIPEGNVEQSTRKTMTIHCGHLCRHLGDRFSIRSLQLADLQDYVTHRSREPGLRGRLVGPTTIKKELATFHTLFAWAREMGYVSGPFPRQKRRRSG